MRKLLILITLALLALATFAQPDPVDLRSYIGGTHYTSLTTLLAADGYPDTVWVTGADCIAAIFHVGTADDATVMLEGSLDAVTWIALFADSIYCVADTDMVLIYETARVFRYYRMVFDEAAVDTLLWLKWKVW